MHWSNMFVALLLLALAPFAQAQDASISTRLLVLTDEPVCLDLRMQRGSDNSPRSNQCVS